jgi:hypothetical protein
MRVLTCAVLAAAGALLVGGTISVSPTAADDKKTEDTKVVPREMIRVSNSDQGNAQLKDWSKKDEERYQDILRTASNTGASNVFLVHGETFNEAVWLTQAMYFSKQGSGHTGQADVVTAPPPGSTTAPIPGQRFKVWVVAYLGSGPSDRWVIKSVERTETRIRVSYVDAGGLRGDVKPYLIWASLGPLDPGKYAVELYDTGAKEVKLTRIVRVR